MREVNEMGKGPFIASVPLGGDGWESLPEASATIVGQGKLLQQARTV
jgi:hypothetical protein